LLGEFDPHWTESESEAQVEQEEASKSEMNLAECLL